MSRVHRCARLGVISLLAVGCGHTEVRQAMLRPAAPAALHPVELYMAGQAYPARPYYEIAIVQAVGFGDKAQAESLAHALTERAAKLGCDAVLRTTIDVGYTRSHASGVCVKWNGPPAAASKPERGESP